jgi:hypothetical protein
VKLVEVYKSFSPADAHLICSALQSAGIPAQVTNEISSLALEGYALASGGIRVVVPEDHFADARAIIERTTEIPENNDPS